MKRNQKHGAKHQVKQGNERVTHWPGGGKEVIKPKTLLKGHHMGIKKVEKSGQWQVVYNIL